MAAGGDALPEPAAELSRLASQAREAASSAPVQVAALRRLAGLLRDAALRETATKSLFQDLLQILKEVSREIDMLSKDIITSTHLNSLLLLLTECFRCLRNACVQCANNQKVMRDLGLIDAAVCLIQVLQKLETDLDSLSTAFRCSLQFLGNIAAGNRDAQNTIWKLAFPSLFLNCLKHQDEKILDYGSMVLFTCLSPERTKDLEEEKNLEIALGVLRASRSYPEAEWVTLIVTSYLLKCPTLVKATYAKLSNQERVILLEVILAEIKEDKVVISEEMAVFLASCFEEKCQTVLRLVSATNDEEALIAIRLLDILCEMTSNPGELGSFLACPHLLEAAINLLQLVHLAGKQTANIFTTTFCTDREPLSHLAVGFKSHLIRLIGNLCYKNKENQDKVYEFDGIPLILDNCSIDDNNPFISQWAVYAVRNLTEENERNQLLIAQLEHQGLASNAVLESMGLTAEQQDQKVILKPVRKAPCS